MRRAWAVLLKSLRIRCGAELTEYARSWQHQQRCQGKTREMERPSPRARRPSLDVHVTHVTLTRFPCQLSTDRRAAGGFTTLPVSHRDAVITARGSARQP